MTRPGAGEPVVCASCGAAPVGEAQTSAARLSWSRGIEAGRVVWTCVDCSRRHLRSIEGKLDSSWW